MKKISQSFLLLLFLSGPSLMSSGAQAQTAPVRDIVFPVPSAYSVYYRDDYGDPRSGHAHEGNDIMGKKMIPLIAAVDGTVSRINFPEADWGYAVILRDNEGYSYWYLHINDDTPGTDNGAGGGMNAYAPYIDGGEKVVKGQLIGWMGDSGNAESTTAHLHFEIHSPGGGTFSPYQSLQRATKIAVPVEPPNLNDEILPFGDFKGGASIAYGNFDSASQHEFVVGAGPGAVSHVRVLTSNEGKIGTFYAYVESFTGGVDVAAGDLDGDGIDEVITGPGPGGGPHVKMFRKDGTPYTTEGFFAFTPNFLGGVNVAAADLNNDKKDEIIVGAGPGGGPHVRIFNGDGTLFSDGFFAYDGAFRGGVDVAGIDAKTGTEAMIITGAGPGGGPHVKVFNAQGIEKNNFFAYDETFLGGVRVSAGAINASGGSSSSGWWNYSYDSYGRNSSNTSSTGVAQIITSPARDGGADIRIYNTNGTFVGKDNMFEEWWQGGYDVAAGTGISYVVTGNGRLSPIGGRRVSIQEGPN